MEMSNEKKALHKTPLTQNLRPIVGAALDRSRRIQWRGSVTVTDAVRRSTDDEVPLQVGHKVSHSPPRHVRLVRALQMSTRDGSIPSAHAKS